MREDFAAPHGCYGFVQPHGREKFILSTSQRVREKTSGVSFSTGAAILDSRLHLSWSLKLRAGNLSIESEKIPHLEFGPRP